MIKTFSLYMAIVVIAFMQHGLYAAVLRIDIKSIEVDDVYKDDTERVLVIEAMGERYRTKVVDRKRSNQIYRMNFRCDVISDADIEIDEPSSMEIVNKCKWYLDAKMSEVYSFPDIRKSSAITKIRREKVRYIANALHQYNFQVDFRRDRNEKFEAPAVLYYDFASDKKLSDNMTSLSGSGCVNVVNLAAVYVGHDQYEPGEIFGK